MKTKHFLSIVMMTIVAVVMFTAFIPPQQTPTPWNAPDKFVKMKNPVASNKESIAAGKELYVKHCKSCHGTKGLGDGTKAAQLKTKCGDFTTKTFQAQTDGSIFYKISEGRDDMPKFKKKIPDEEDIWSIVNYLRTL